MSNTTVINSKSMQALLAHSENRPGAQSNGTTFHQMLEGALTEKAKADTAPASLVKSDPSAVSTKLAKALSGATLPRRPDADKQLGVHGAKPAAPLPAANDDAVAGAASETGSSQALAKAVAAATDSPKLDTTQLKVVNAPPAPEAPATMAHAAPGAPRSGPAASTKPNPTIGPLAPAAGSASTSAAAPRGFTAALANAHLSGTLPSSLVDQASFDPTLHLSITPQAAHLSMDTGASGPLLAQLQITNGVADVHLTGEAASVLARHGAELSLGLTAAGLQPGRVEITAPAAGADLQSATSDGSGAGAFRSDAQARDGSETQDRDPPSSSKLAERSIPAASSTLSGRASRVHVKA